MMPSTAALLAGHSGLRRLRFGLSRAVIAVLLALCFLFAGGFAASALAAESDAGGDAVPELTADEFIEWLEGKELAFLELWDPA